MENTPDAAGHSLTAKQIGRINDARRSMIEATAADDLSTVPILGKVENIVVHERTGILLAIAESHFLVTAAHKLRNRSRDGMRFFIPPANRGGTPIPLDGIVTSAGKELDVAVWELADDAVAQLKLDRRFLRIADVDFSANPKPGVYVIRGYPSEMNRAEPNNQTFRVRILRFLAEPYSGELPHSADSPFDPLKHVLLRHSERGQDATGNYTDAPPIDGMSGCGIWRLASFDQRFKDWQPDNRKLIAIQTACKSDSYFKGTWIVYALELIARRRPELAVVMNRLYPP